MKIFSKHHGVLVFLVSVLATVSCSSTPDDGKAIYGASKLTKSLEVPPDLELPVMNKEYRIPGIASQQTSYSIYSGSDAKQTGVITGIAKGVRLVREDNLVWLEIKSSPDKLWPQLQLFLQNTGFEIASEDKLVGIMETNWLENQADVPGSWLNSAVLMDKYRIRLERSPKPDTTLVFIRHRGMREVHLSEFGSETVDSNWEIRASDPELEAEMLQRFLVFGGMDKKQLAAITDDQTKSKNTRILTGKDGQVILEVKENFPRTWRRVGLALDRMGLVIEDRNRSAGVYYIRLPDNFDAENDKSWFAGLFGDKQAVAMKRDYLLSIDASADKTEINIRARGQKTIDSKVAEKILSQVQNHIS